MRPTLLEMEGFGSFRDKTKIDFRDADVAALVGPTGSGKSTVIDAIIFALYGRVPRYNALLAPVINQGASRASVRLRFVAGNHEYVAARIAQLDKQGKASTKEARLERVTEGTPQVLAGQANEMAAQVEALLGLSYDQFTKTVVLPQGNFARFLHDTSADRKKALNHLLDFGIYDAIRIQAGAKARTAEGEIKAFMETAASATSDEEVKAKEKLLGETESARKALVSELGHWDELAQQAQTITETCAKITNTISHAESVAIPADVGVITDLARRAKRHLERAEILASQASADEADARDAVAEGPNRGELQRVEDAYRRYEKAASDTTHKAADAAATQAEAEKAEVARSEAAQTHHDAVIEAEDVRGKIDAENTARQLHVKHLEAADNHQLNGCRHSMKETEALERQTALRLSEATERKRKVEHQRGAWLLAQGLTPGSDCPVCAQQVNEVICERSKHSLSEEDHATWAQIVDEGYAADKAHTTTRLAVERAKVTLEAAEAKSAECEKALREQLQTSTCDLPDDQAAIATLSDQIRDDEDREDAAVEKEMASHGQLQVISAQAVAANEDVAASQGRLEEMRSQAASCQSELLEAPPLKDVVTQLGIADGLVASLQETERQAKVMSERLEQARLDAQQRAYAETEATAGYQTAREMLALEVMPALRSLCDGDSAQNLPTAKGSLSAKWETLRAWVETQIESLSGKAEELDALLHQTQAEQETWMTENRPGFQAYLDANQPPETWAALMKEVLTEAEHSVLTARQSHQKGVEHQRKATEAEDRYGIAKDLERRLGTKGFPAWRMESVVRRLATSASEHLLNLSGGQFSLIASGGDFMIWNHDTEEERTTRSLSGGETFLASLSLALALADEQSAVGSGDAPVLGSLFIDEGFGTLDSDTLDVTAAAIETLGEQGRMVCVVSHIRELAERMPLRFEVTRTGESSTVRTVAA